MGILFPREPHSTIQTMASMAADILAAKAHCRRIDAELAALYDHLGIEPRMLSGYTFVKKGKD